MKEKRGRAYETADIAAMLERAAAAPPPTSTPADDQGQDDGDGDGDDIACFASLDEIRGAGYDPSVSSAAAPSAAVSSGKKLHYTSEGWARDWNAEFQELVDLGDGDNTGTDPSSGSEEKFARMYRLAHDFVSCAVLYARIIISELCVPAEHKTIPPADVGGVAGGEKFCVQNILFKKLVDSRITDSVWMYGGPRRSDAHAMKAGLHELKGVMSWSATHVELLHYPLVAAIDYKGFRMLAISVLPIDRATLACGSADGGVTVHGDNAVFAARLDEAGAILNLKPHLAGTTPGRLKLTRAPGDLEGHVGKDGRFYLLDFSRSMPPEFSQRAGEPRAVYYKLLRPEFVLSMKGRVALCADALTNW
jgi:hypothetical protein